MNVFAMYKPTIDGLLHQLATERLHFATNPIIFIQQALSFFGMVASVAIDDVHHLGHSLHCEGTQLLLELFVGDEFLW